MKDKRSSVPYAREAVINAIPAENCPVKVHAI